jgi:hypothetical protein
MPSPALCAGGAIAGFLSRGDFVAKRIFGDRIRIMAGGL